MAKNLSGYIEDAIDKSPHLIYTPIRSKLHLLWINTNKSIQQHPWARFVRWWLDTYSRQYGQTYEQKLFNPLQMIEIVGKYSIQFHYPSDENQAWGHLPYVTVMSFGHQEPPFHVYNVLSGPQQLQSLMNCIAGVEQVP